MPFKRIFLILSFLIASFFLWNFWKKNDIKNFQESVIKKSISNNLLKIDKNHDLVKSDFLYYFYNEKKENSPKINLLFSLNNKIFLKNFQFLIHFLNLMYSFEKNYNQDIFKDLKKNIILKNYMKKKNDKSIKKKKSNFFMSWILKTKIKYKRGFIFQKEKKYFKKKYFFNDCLKKNFFLNDFQNFLNKNFYLSIPFEEQNKFYKFTQNKLDFLINKEILFSKEKKKMLETLKIFFLMCFTSHKNFFYTIIYNKNINLQILNFQNCVLKTSIRKSFIQNKCFTNLIIPVQKCLVSSYSEDIDPKTRYGFLWFLSQPLFEILKFFNKIIGNWGFSIILMTIFIRLLMYPITQSQYVAMYHLKNLQPKLDFLKEKYKNNKQKMGEKVLDLYKKNNISPFSGLLSLIIQMPIFLSFYYTLTNSPELKNAQFILWIKDLSIYDPFYILPILMGITMIITQIISSQKNLYEIFSGNIQEKLMFFIPIFFIVFFLWFPAGLVLYYIISNIISIIQQKYIYNFYDNKKIL